MVPNPTNYSPILISHFGHQAGGELGAWHRLVVMYPPFWLIGSSENLYATPDCTLGGFS